MCSTDFPGKCLISLKSDLEHKNEMILVYSEFYSIATMQLWDVFMIPK